MRIRLIPSLLLAAGILWPAAASFAQISASITVAPPELPVYEQPICPGDGYIWTPGYWAWNGQYDWVQGSWVMAPQVGFLWTPGYWGWGGSGFIFNEGYWGSSVGFYGGINYGFGYFGRGYDGGRWDNGHFFYNTTLNNVNRESIHNVYNTRINETGNRVSYNGGRGGIEARATDREMATAREHASAGNRGAGGGAARTAAVHPRDLSPIERSQSNTGNAKLDQKYQAQQGKLIARQNQDRQKLQNQQESEHQRMAKQTADPGRTQQVEQRHQQQTQQLQQRHTQQTQQMQQRQQPAGGGGSRGGGRR